MRCCVSFCVNNSEIICDSKNVTFHRLPTEKLRRAAWIQALGIEERSLQTVRGPSICSLHFRQQDFHTTKTGLWAVKRSAVPKNEQICIICLDTGSRLFPLNYYNLEAPYENVTGISLSKFNAIRSPRVCAECGQRMLSCNAFRDKCVRAHRLLLKLSRQDDLLRYETIKKVNRKKHKLKSNLTKEIFEPNHCDYHLIHDERSKNVKIESSSNLAVKRESIVYGSDIMEEMKNEAAKSVGLRPKQEGANKEVSSELELLHVNIVNDEFLSDHVNEIVKNDKDNVVKKNDSCKDVKLLNKNKHNVDRHTINDSGNDVKLLSKGIKVDIEFSNQPKIDHDTDFADENADKVNKNDCNVNSPDENADIDIDENGDDVDLRGETDDIDIDENYVDVNLPGETDDIDIDENYVDVNLPGENDDIGIDENYMDVNLPCETDDIDIDESYVDVNLPCETDDIDIDESYVDVNLPGENDDIEMDVPNENDSDVELVEPAIESDDKKFIKAKPNKGTLNANKYKVKRQKKVSLNKPKVKLNELNGTSNKNGSAGKGRKRIRKRKTECQGQYLRRKPPTGGMELFKVSVLTYEEQIADLHSRKDTSVYKNSTFKCPHCFKAYQFEQPYDAHMLQHTDKYGQFECAICGIHAVSRQKLLHHLNMAHAVRYSCTRCAFHTRHRNTAKSHGRAHQGTKTKCPQCGDVEFTNLNSLMSHVRKKHPSACVCPVCGYSFSGKTGLTLHLQRKHQLQDAQGELGGPLCAECDIRFASQTAYEQHLAVSLRHTTEDNAQPNAPPRRRFKGLPRRRGAQTVTCEQCGAKLKGFKHYSIHFESQHSDKARTQFANPHERRCLCELCGRVFQNSSALKSHMLIHAGKKDVQCSVCDKRFYYQRQLTLHMDVHGEPKRTFDCPVCARSFTNKSNKNRHLWTHTQVSRPFKCHACPKTFVYPSERKFHINHAHANQPYPKKPKNRVRNSRPKHVKEAPYGQIEPLGINEASYLSETSAI